MVHKTNRFFERRRKAFEDHLYRLGHVSTDSPETVIYYRDHAEAKMMAPIHVVYAGVSSCVIVKEAIFLSSR